MRERGERAGERAASAAAPAALDEIDRVLLRELQRDGRISYAALAERTGLSAPAVRQRVQRLRDEGVVQIVGVTDPMALGLPVMALIGVRVDGDVHAVADAISELAGVIYVVLTSGSFDLFAEVVCREPAELLAVINDHIRRVPGVTRAEAFTYFGIHTHRFAWPGT
ncbi:Lrp/AsnC family transcriptional regulator [Microbispora corallina]|uniref:Transcriptional regulator, AsnC family protein n=1 Tax=Microbispora corallina TaxID=83302 RepID=A0ABQ4FWD9_9ACTN|nr:Lrp/AsnC family transcriptional regulator [Microbispora corallina]GIH39105.1 putative transcriptional regulator, AsnC family protein [Microbispora corallina]